MTSIAALVHGKFPDSYLRYVHCLLIDKAIISLFQETKVGTLHMKSIYGRVEDF